jgi:hypothetical protein
MKLYWISVLSLLLCVNATAKELRAAAIEYYKPYSLIINGHLGLSGSLNTNRKAGQINDMLNSYNGFNISVIDFSFILPDNYSIESICQFKAHTPTAYQAYNTSIFPESELIYRTYDSKLFATQQYGVGVGKSKTLKHHYFKGALFASYSSTKLDQYNLENRIPNTNQYYNTSINNYLLGGTSSWNAWGSILQLQHSYLITKYASLYYNVQYTGHYTSSKPLPIAIRNETTYEVTTSCIKYDDYQHGIGMNFGMNIKLINFNK